MILTSRYLRSQSVAFIKEKQTAIISSQRLIIKVASVNEHLFVLQLLRGAIKKKLGHSKSLGVPYLSCVIVPRHTAQLYLFNEVSVPRYEYSSSGKKTPRNILQEQVESMGGNGHMEYNRKLPWKMLKFYGYKVNFVLNPIEFNEGFIK